MVIACVLGILAGLLGFAPYPLIKKVARHMGNMTKGISGIALGMLGAGLSFIFLLAAVLVYLRFAPEQALVFVVATVGTFLVATVVFVIVEVRRS